MSPSETVQAFELMVGCKVPSLLRWKADESATVRLREGQDELEKAETQLPFLPLLTFQNRTSLA